jgi:hypothetical protein
MYSHGPWQQRVGFVTNGYVLMRCPDKYFMLLFIVRCPNDI